ncbi:Ig-like domain-containing protein [Methanobacterium spitsbergense]|uniref:Ig-like domain-containing protein n=1 Tax=Methanobacterium spitsbergense TaxID=2874285 RepID=A0A8T5V2B9_9EURY|nr:Ig-like domain-containing protein [Methanobacterium spitsbergense]
MVLNLSTITAANVTSNTAPKVTSVNPVNNSVILKSQTINVYFNEPIKAGTLSITLKNSAGTTISTKKSINYRTLSIVPSTALPTGVKYNLILNSGSIKDSAGKGNSYYTTSFTVSPITLAQMKDGVSRAQTFYNINHRLPTYVSYGSKKIAITTFKKIIATQGLKIKTTTINVTSNTAPKVTSVNPVNNSVILKSQTINVYFNEPIKAGTLSITLKNSAGTTISTKKSINYRTLSIVPSTALPTGVKYNLILNSGSIKDSAGKGNSYYTTSFTISPITLAQMKDGLSRAQTFFNTNLRLPSYVSFGTKRILIAEFQKIIATQGLKINTKIKDLTVTQVTAPTTGVKGNTIIVPNTVKNQGNTATGGFYINYYLINNSSIYIGQRYISSLAAGASNSQNTKLSIPLNITSSSYYIDVYADSSKIVSESNESNNYKYSTTKIQIINSINSRPIYLTSDWIYDEDVDNAKMDRIVSGLKAMGLYAMNYGWGANSHYQILKDITIPQNALVVDIYGGVCAGTIWEMTQDSYKYYKGNRSVFSIWTYTNIDIANVTFLRRAYDDKFTPLYGTTIDKSSFPSYNDSNNDGNFDPGAGYVNGIIDPTKLQELDGIYYPADLLLSNGYHYLYQQNGDIAAIVSSIYNEATSNF